MTNRGGCKNCQNEFNAQWYRSVNRFVKTNYAGLNAEQIRTLYFRQKARCALTGDDLNTATMTVDHIIPRSRGGSDDMSNLQLVNSRELNALKHNFTPDELYKICHKIIRTHEKKISSLF